MEKILVSACLLGFDCRYKGDNCLNEKVVQLSKKYDIIPICPEQMGGLSTPRDPSERVNDKVFSSKGVDVTLNYEKGAKMALKLAMDNNVKFCVLKAKSPSCGKGLIYDGTFSGNKIPGNGLTVDLLLSNGFKVYTEDEIDNL